MIFRKLFVFDLQVAPSAHGYQCKWLGKPQASIIALMNLNLRTTQTCLLISLANLPLTVSAFMLGLWTPYGEWAVLFFMVFVPLLIATTVVLVLRDVWRPASRRQAILALLISVPPLVAEGWFYNRGKGWP